MGYHETVKLKDFRVIEERVYLFSLEGLKVELESIELESQNWRNCWETHSFLHENPFPTAFALKLILEFFRSKVITQTLFNRTVSLLCVLIADGEGDIHEHFFPDWFVFATIDIGMGGSLEKLFDPSSVFMCFLDGFEEFSAKLLNIVLLEGLCIGPLEAFEEITSIRRFVLGLQINK